MDTNLLEEAFRPHVEKINAAFGWLAPTEAATLFCLAATLQTDKPVIVEIGSYVGKSSICLAAGLQHQGKGGRLYCVDPFDETDQLHYLDLSREFKLGTIYESFQKNVADYPNVTAVPGFSARVALHADVIPLAIDMLFIDGNHTYSAVKTDVLSWVPSLKPGGILAMHDVNLPGDWSLVPNLEGGWCTDPIRVVCDLGLGLDPCGWEGTTRVESLFVTRRSATKPWLTLMEAKS